MGTFLEPLPGWSQTLSGRTLGPNWTVRRGLGRCVCSWLPSVAMRTRLTFARLVRIAAAAAADKARGPQK